MQIMHMLSYSPLIVSHAGPFSSQLACEEALKKVMESREQLTNLKSQEATLRRGLSIFKIDQPPAKEIQQVDKVF